jgi:site-specific recombinase
MKTLLHKIAESENYTDYALLQSLVEMIRPSKAKNGEEAVEQIQNLIAYLKSYPEYQDTLSVYTVKLFGHYNPVEVYTELGILNNRGFFNEFWTRLEYKILPKATDRYDTGTLLSLLFNKSDDYIWIDFVPKDLWLELAEYMGISGYFTTEQEAFEPLICAIQSLSHNIAAMSFDHTLSNKLPKLDRLDSPFLNQNKELTLFIEQFQQHSFTELENSKFNYINQMLDECSEIIYTLRKRKNEIGTSLHLTYIARRLIQQIDRLRMLLQLFHERDPVVVHSNLIILSKILIRAENQKTSLSKLISENTDLLAYEIVEHTAKKGDKYIANNAGEYWGYLRASMLGGAAIAFFASFKIFADQWSLPPLGQGLIFSLNYALCFVLVKLMGGIIATKQPAMTASAVVQSMDNDGDGMIDNLHGLKDLIIKISRSQFISFVGNLICAFPIAFLLAQIYQWIYGTPMVDQYKSESLLTDIHPINGAALYYAGIAGICLSLSGLISGYFDNKVVYGRLSQRIRFHPILRRWLSKNRRNRIANYIENNLGVLSGNISLGFFLGMAGTIGFITGLPIDIRHIAFSSANFGIALEYSHFSIPAGTIIAGILGIVGIGFINFIVSFGMTLTLALKSRSVTFNQTRALTKLLFAQFLKTPLAFFISPRKT